MATVLGPETLLAIENVRACRERIISRRLWAVLVLARDPQTAESILAGRPVMTRNLDPEALRRALRGEPLPPPDSFVRVRHGHLEAVAECGPLRERRDHKAQILATGPDPDSLHRDRCALRLLLTYALRKESLRQVRYSHFDQQPQAPDDLHEGRESQDAPHRRSRLRDDLGRHIIEWEAQPDDFLLCRCDLRPNRHKAGEKFVTEYRDQPMGVHGLHKWWYRCLERAGIVMEGQTSRRAGRCTWPATPLARRCSTRPAT